MPVGTTQEMTDPETFQPIDNRGPIVVPFFPTHWQETANAIFNNDFTILKGSVNSTFQPEHKDSLSPAFRHKIEA